MLNFKSIPTDYRTIYNNELQKIDNYLSFLDEINGMYNHFVEEHYNNNRSGNDGNVGNIVHIESDTYNGALFVIFENTNRIIGYTIDDFKEVINYKRTVKNISFLNNNPDSLLKYKMYYSLYKKNCENVLNNSKIDSYLLKKEVNFIKVIDVTKVTFENALNVGRISMVGLTFLHSANLQSYFLKLSENYEEFLNHDYWQVNIKNDDVTRVIKSDKLAFENSKI